MIYLSNLAIEVSEQYYSMHSWLYLIYVTGIWKAKSPTLQEIEVLEK